MKKKTEKIYQTLQRRLSSRLSELRAEQGMTLMQLGEVAGLHWRHLQKIEAGQVNVTLTTIARLANGLGVQPWELVATAS